MALLLVGSALAASAAPAWGQGATASSPPELARVADTLKPGQWVWAASIAPAGPIMVYVDLSRQIATVYRNGVRIGVSTVSSGRDGYATPTGVFTILQKDANHHSNVYHNAPMLFQQRLTWDGVALHAGGLPGYPESHGCVHLPYGFSKELFAITGLGATVVIAGDAVNHVRTSDNSLLLPIDAKGQPAMPVLLGSGDYAWTPARAPTGPLTIIVSKSDQRVVVLRNGIEIGRSAAQVDDTDTGSHVITLTKQPNGAARWVYVGLPGHDEDAGRPLDEATLNRLRLPRAFYAALKPLLVPGTTILVTWSSVGDDGRRGRLTILDAVAPTP
ncbi:L,D-transpeptidase [Sphingomonas nostoxanthinifaciens]|uniref:L,D-transpeptidase n=1 Tax=Sphingomonas nostoxanthinifaciens TaxID=2872652 RepID=UPI001CC1DF2F|nr:L,D-transpeptidase [Sphingomonas nostoxanthinifaciens]UAK24537.1 L,D-transpeptidase [Sphingomonas nostoxanthinifaciens]